MFALTPYTDPRNRRPPTLGTTLLFAALPFVALFAAAFPALTAGLFVGLVAGITL